jgi:hypothetical protein
LAHANPALAHANVVPDSHVGSNSHMDPYDACYADGADYAERNGHADDQDHLDGDHCAKAH